MSYFTDGFDERVIGLLKNGAVGLLPSDTIYGLSALALEEQAVRRVHTIKDRSSSKPFIILISDLKMLDLLSISGEQISLAKPYWPGQLSVIFDAPDSPAWLTCQTKSLAVRLPANAGLRRLVSEVGPIISTSANQAGKPPISTVKEAIKVFGEKLDFYVDTGTLENPPSTVAGIKDGKLETIRQGAVKID